MKHSVVQPAPGTAARGMAFCSDPLQGAEEHVQGAVGYRSEGDTGVPTCAHAPVHMHLCGYILCAHVYVCIHMRVERACGRLQV